MYIVFNNIVYVIDRGDGAKGMSEIFFKQIRSWKEDKGTYPPPFIVSLISIMLIIGAPSLIRFITYLSRMEAMAYTSFISDEMVFIS